MEIKSIARCDICNKDIGWCEEIKECECPQCGKHLKCQSVVMPNGQGAIWAMEKVEIND